MDEQMGLTKIAEVTESFEEVKEAIKTKVVGQDKAVDEVMDSIANSFLFEQTTDNRPRGIFLFAGTPGVGKTFLSETCAKYLGFDCLTLNMSTYSSNEDSKMNLFGLDYSWKSSRQGTLLSFVDKQNGNPCIIILDEFEKAHMQVILQFLQIFESGKCEDVYVISAKEANKSGKKIPEWIMNSPDEVSFSNVYFFITTNAGRSLYENGKQPDPNLTKDAIIDAIRKDINPQTKEPYFPDAILSRLQTGTVVMFRHLETNELIKIGNNVLSDNAKLIQDRYGINIDIEPQITDLLLLKEGGQVDPRNFRKITEKFLRNQVTNLTFTLRKELQTLNDIYICVDPEEKETLDKILYGEQNRQEAIFVCEDERMLQIMSRKFMEIEDISIKSTTSYAEALQMAKNEIFDVPLIFAVLPSIKDDEGLTMASNKSVMQSRSLYEFKKFIEDVKSYNDKATLCIIDIMHATDETKRELLSQGATDVITLKKGRDVNTLIREKVENIRINNMAFDFSRKGKALTYDIVPAVYNERIFVRFRNFEKINNVKGTDADYLTSGERMPNISFEDVVGGEKIKEEAKDFITFLRNPKSFVSKGLKAPKGLLFFGPAGTGKTFMAKAIAHEADVPFFATNGGDIKMGKDDKNGSELLKMYFDMARRYAPSILFIDEMETIALNRTGADSYADTIVNTLLSEMDGFEGHDSNPVIVIGATNAGDSYEHNVDGRFLDPAVVRRFSRRFFVDVPDKENRLKYINKLTKNASNLSEKELETAAQMSQGLSFGKIGNAIEIAKRLAVRENRVLSRIDIENAIETENFGEVKAASPENKERTAYHEAGHAAIGCIVGGNLLPDHATIISRGDFGGYVSTALGDSVEVYSKEFFENKIRLSLAGRCAEIIHYGEKDGLTYGPASDIKQAYRIIFDMVCHLGMDDEVGVTYYPYSYEDKNKDIPDAIQTRINILFKKYYEDTMRMLLNNKEMFEEIAGKLITQESLSKSELREISERYHG